MWQFFMPLPLTDKIVLVMSNSQLILHVHHCICMKLGIGGLYYIGQFSLQLERESIAKLCNFIIRNYIQLSHLFQSIVSFLHPLNMTFHPLFYKGQ